jgi:hypothetical protein
MFCGLKQVGGVTKVGEAGDFIGGVGRQGSNVLSIDVIFIWLSVDKLGLMFRSALKVISKVLV